MRTRTRWLAAVVTVLLAVTAAACGDTGEAGPRVEEIVVPLGTGERIAAGEDLAIMPSELSFRVGDTLRIRNEDVVDQSVGPYWVTAGEEFEITYGSPGRFEGMCPLSEGDRYVIEITQ